MSAPDWSRHAHGFRHLDGSPVEMPPRVTVPEPRRAVASIEAWRTSPAVVREYNRGFRNGFISAMVFYGVLSAVLVLAFHFLGVHP